MLGLLDDPHPAGEARDRDDDGGERDPEDDGELVEAGQHLDHDAEEGNRDDDEDAHGALGEVAVVAEGVGDDGVEAGDEQDEDVVLELFKMGGNGVHDVLSL